jgi:CoA:oxalate CoA-transferase
MAADPQVQAREMIVELEHPIHGPIKEFGISIKLSDTPGTIRTPAPALGENTDQILQELGMSAEEIKTLREKKIIA